MFVIAKKKHILIYKFKAKKLRLRIRVKYRFCKAKLYRFTPQHRIICKLSYTYLKALNQLDK